MAIRYRELSIFGALLILCAGCDPKGRPILPFSQKTVVMRPSAPAPVDAESLPAETVVTPAETTEPTLASDDQPTPTVAKVAEPAPPSADPLQILYADSFADLQGSIHWNKSGVKSAEGPPNQRTVYFFMGTPEGGPLAMQVFEDMMTRGPDGEPGVLALSWQEIPPKLPYSGFVYLGGVVPGRMTLPTLMQAKTAEDLRGLRLSFRFKGVNQRNDIPVKLNIGCRLEPNLPNSFARRIDLGKFTATHEWGTFDMPLVDGKNTEAFLRAIMEESPPQFKVVWAQEGPLANYYAGDTLLIDDVAVTKATPE